jgi:predicted anti-sigma-YlaC factor YlaD
MSTASCESFEILIERERYGAASSEERAELATHLTTCERCRVYAETAERARRGLAAMANAPTPALDWAKLETRLRDEGRRRLRRTFLLALIGPIAVALSIWGLPHPGAPIDAALVAAIIGARIAVDVVRTRRLARPMERGEFFSVHRQELARQIRRLAILRWVALAVIVVILGLAVAMPELTVRGRIVFVALGAIVAAVWAERLFVGLPSLRRELSMIEQGPG